MRIAVSLLFLALISACAAPGQVIRAMDSQGLIGVWKVDLRLKPNDPAYFQEFIVTAINGKTFSGTFYGAPVEQARINIDWRTVPIAFVTSDRSGR